MKIKELLSDASKWTQGRHAADEKGNDELPESSNAVCWCLSGAIMKCYLDDNEIANRLRFKIVDKINRYIKIKSNGLYIKYSNNIIPWNDDKNRTFEDIKILVETLDV